MNIKQKLVSAKTKIVANKTKILGSIAIGATTAVIIQQIGLKQHDEFLKEHGLYDAFYTPEED